MKDVKSFPGKFLVPHLSSQSHSLRVLKKGKFLFQVEALTNHTFLTFSSDGQFQLWQLKSTLTTVNSSCDSKNPNLWQALLAPKLYHLLNQALLLNSGRFLCKSLIRTHYFHYVHYQFGSGTKYYLRLLCGWNSL